jgi:hypothetical protein
MPSVGPVFWPYALPVFCDRLLLTVGLAIPTIAMVAESQRSIALVVAG